MDSALLRPGRVHKQFYMDHCNIEQLNDMFCNFFAGLKEEELDEAKRSLEQTKRNVSPAEFENFLLRFNKDYKEALNNLHVLDEGIESEYRLRHSEKTIIYRQCDNYSLEWKPFGKPKAKRSWSTVFTQNRIKEDLFEDIVQFQRDEEWYHKQGIPYRRGYLLYGPPGTGKSSLIYSLAGKLDFGICILKLRGRDMTDDGLMQSLATVPYKSFVLIEDIDAVLPTKKRLNVVEGEAEHSEEESRSSLTLSGILNAIDGVASEESQILFMTTNHKEVLDEAIIRPGRIDKKFHLDNCNASQCKDMFHNFFPFAKEEEVDEMRRKFEDIKHPISPAHLQGYLHGFKGSLIEALQNTQMLNDLKDS
jgi:chaperone BCS1